VDRAIDSSIGEAGVSDPTAPLRPQHSLRRAAYLTASFGAIYSVLFLVAYWLVSGQPGPGASDAEVLSFYATEAPRRFVLVGLYLMPFAGIAFVWFIVACACGSVAAADARIFSCPISSW
jgi:hypothetical protein